jgi:hypothetical protein
MRALASSRGEGWFNALMLILCSATAEARPSPFLDAGADHELQVLLG